MSQLGQNLEKLPVFLEVVRSGSIRSAAKKLGLSQPAVSRIVRLLEEALAARLLERGQGGVELTEVGEKLFKLADKIRIDSEAFEAEVHAEEKIRQKLTIGTYESIAVYFFPEFLQYVTRAQGQLELGMYTAPSPMLMEALRRSRVDLILSVNPASYRDVLSVPLFSDEYGIYCRPSLEVGRKTPLLAFSAAADRNGKTIDKFVDESNHAKRPRFVCESFESVKALTLAGLGIGILPTRVALASVRSGALVEFIPSGQAIFRFGPHGIALSYLKHREGDAGIVWIQRALERFEARSR